MADGPTVVIPQQGTNTSFPRDMPGNSSEDGSLQDQLTHLRMKMMQQKLANERSRLTRPDSVESTHDIENQYKLQQALLRRQELLDRIRLEQLNNQNNRPRTQSPRRRYTPSPLPPPSRLSLPDLSPRYYTKEFPKPQYTYREPKTYREPAVQAANNNALNPGNKQPNPNPVIIPAPEIKFLQTVPPQITTMAQPPQIITQPAPQHIIQTVPQPVVQHLGPAPQEKNHFNKGDFLEMMAMQNVQSHQSMMQELMFKTYPFNRYANNCSCQQLQTPGCCDPHQPCYPAPYESCYAPSYSNIAPSYPIDDPHHPPIRSPVCHHHFPAAPAPAPAVHHYASLPQLDITATTPAYRAYDSGYYYVSDDNYYSYH